MNLRNSYPLFTLLFLLNGVVLGAIYEGPARAQPVKSSRNASQFNWLVDPGFEMAADRSAWDGVNHSSPGYRSDQALFFESTLPEWKTATQVIDIGNEAPARIAVSCWMKTEDVEVGSEPWMKARMVVNFSDSNGHQVGGWQDSAMDVVGTTDWTRYEHSYLVPAGATRVMLELQLPNCVGKAWFDDATLAMIDEGRVQRVAEYRTDTSDWYPFVPTKDRWSTALDLSFLNEKPAGKHGFVQAHRGHFVFEDSTVARFWGTNIGGEDVFLTHQIAEGVARHLSRLGVNLVRLQSLDASWALRNIFDPHADNTQTFCEESLDQLDYLIAELKKNGIYVHLVLFANRRFKKGDNVPDYDKLPGEANGVVRFSARVIELNKQFAKTLLTHKNKYTGLSLAEDPVMVSTEIVNESSIFCGFDDKDYPPAFEAELQSLYEKWGGKGKVARFGYDHQARALRIVKNPEHAAESLRFLAQTQDKTNAEMKTYLRSIGVRALITGSNIGIPVEAEIRSNAKMDFVDTHVYWDHPKVWEMPREWSQVDIAPFDNTSQLANPTGATIFTLCTWKVADKPMVVTEWNQCFPNEYRLEGPMIMASYGSLQGLDGLLQFDYTPNSIGAAKMGQFDIHSRPDNEPLFQAGALIFRNRYIEPTSIELVDVIGDEVALGEGSKSPWLHDHPWLPYAVRVAKRFTFDKQSVSPALDKVAGLHDEHGKMIRSPLQELILDYGHGLLLRIDAPKVQGVVGDLSASNTFTSQLAVRADKRNPWACVVAMSLNDKPLEESERILLIAVAHAENSGQIFNITRTALKEPGHIPILMQGVKAEVTLGTLDSGKALIAGSHYVILPLNSEGTPGMPLQADIKDGRLHFTLSPSDRTTLYLIHKSG